MKALLLTLVFVSILVRVVAVAASAAPAERPNILILLADDLGWADVGFNGSKEVATPHLDSLAANGVRFSAGYVTAPQCSPSRAGLLTGRYQQRFGHDNNNVHLACFRTGQKIFPEHVKKAGYITGAVGKWHLGMAPTDHPLQHGFDEFFGFQGGGHAYLNERWQDADNPVVRGTQALPLDGSQFLTTSFGGESAAFVRRHADQPWFLYAAFNAPHTPMTMPPGYEEKVKHISNPNRARCVAMIMNLDDTVGEILDALRATGQEERTLIFFLSDNGGTGTPGNLIKNASLNIPFRGVKGDVYEGGVRVPFVVQWKGRIPAGKTYEAPISSLDLLPTALAAAGVTPLAGTVLDGVDLLPFLRGERTDHPHFLLYWRWQNISAVRQGDWKWVQNKTEPAELYDLATDPFETTNLAAREPQRLKELGELYSIWNAKNPELDPAHRERDSNEGGANGELTNRPQPQKKTK